MNSTIDLCQTPAGVSPNGQYNFVNPSTLAPAVIGIGVTLTVISTTLAVGRLIANRKRLLIADYFTLSAVLWNIAYLAVICVESKVDRHSWDTPVCWYTGKFLRLPFVQSILFVPATFLPKAAIFLLYRQLFGSEKRFRISVDIGMLVTFLVYISNIPLAVVYAAPRPGKSWDSLLNSLRSNARPFATGGIVQITIETLLNFYIFFLPMHILYNLNMPSRRRWQLVAVFSIAILGVAASVASLVCRVELLTTTDPNWLSGITVICSLIEVNIAIIVGCMPAFAQFVRLYIKESPFFQSLRSLLMGSQDTDSSNNISNESPVKVNTFGSNQKPRGAKYYEMSDTMLLKTQSTIRADASDMN